MKIINICLSSLCRTISMALCQNCTFVCLSTQKGLHGFMKTSGQNELGFMAKCYACKTFSRCALLCSVLALALQCAARHVCVSTNAIIYLICNHCHISYTFYHTHIIHFISIHFVSCICICTFHTLIFNTYRLAKCCLPASLPAFLLALTCFARIHARILKGSSLFHGIYFPSLHLLRFASHRFFTQCAYGIGFSLYHSSIPYSADFSCSFRPYVCVYVSPVSVLFFFVSFLFLFHLLLVDVLRFSIHLLHISSRNVLVLLLLRFHFPLPLWQID